MNREQLPPDERLFYDALPPEERADYLTWYAGTWAGHRDTLAWQAEQAGFPSLATMIRALRLEPFTIAGGRPDG